MCEMQCLYRKENIPRKRSYWSNLTHVARCTGVYLNKITNCKNSNSVSYCSHFNPVGWHNHFNLVAWRHSHFNSVVWQAHKTTSYLFSPIINSSWRCFCLTIARRLLISPSYCSLSLLISFSFSRNLVWDTRHSFVTRFERRLKVFVQCLTRDLANFFAFLDHVKTKSKWERRKLRLMASYTLFCLFVCLWRIDKF